MATLNNRGIQLTLTPLNCLAVILYAFWVPMIESIRVALLPSLIDSDSLAGHTVVVTDILRATTTICMALENGVVDVNPTPDIQAAHKRHQEIGADCILGGERQGVIIEGFDQGNSPREYTSEIVRGRQLVLCTTNGTVAMEICRPADRVLIGSMVNISALVETLATAKNVAIVCAGTNRNITAEDVLFAGAVVDRLFKKQPQAILDDQAMIALGNWQTAERKISAGQTELWQCFSQSLGGQNLMKLGYDEDVKFCAQMDVVDFVPELDVERWAIHANRIDC